MPRLRTLVAARSLSGLLVNVFRDRHRERFSSTSSSEDFVTDSSDDSSTTIETSSSSSTSSEDERPRSRRQRTYETRSSTARTQRGRSASSTVQLEPSTTDDHETEEGSTGSEEEVRQDDSEHTLMENSSEGSGIQILEDDTNERSSQNRRTSQIAGGELTVFNGPKRRRTDNSAAEDEQIVKPGTSTSAASFAACVSALEDDGLADDSCSICYEEYTSAGEHRLSSVKCGHFFGYSCIARWIRSEGRNAVCPTCKTKTNMKDVRKHYTSAVKVTDTAEMEMLRNSNAALNIRVSGLEVDLARKDREICELMKKLQEGKTIDSSSSIPNLVVQQRGGRMFMNPERKGALALGNVNADARAMDFNGEVWAVGVACAQARNIFNPFGIRLLTITRSEFKLRECFPLHGARSRVVIFSPFESSLLLSAGEDKRAIVSMNGTVRRQWRMPHEKPVWTGCWTAPNKVVLGLGDGRVYEYAVDSDSTEPIRDYTQGVGHLPIIFTGFDPRSSTLLVASFKKLVAFRNDKVFPLLNNVEDHFDKMRSISFDEGSLHFAVTFSPGGRHPGISHRLYRLDVDDDNDEVLCVDVAQWLTECQMSSTMWSNCLFSLRNSLFSVVYNEDHKRFDAHDWSGRRTDAMISFPSSSTVAAVRAVPADCDSKKTIVVLGDKAIFLIAFGLCDPVS